MKKRMVSFAIVALLIFGLTGTGAAQTTTVVADATSQTAVQVLPPTAKNLTESDLETIQITRAASTYPILTDSDTANADLRQNAVVRVRIVSNTPIQTNPIRYVPIPGSVAALVSIQGDTVRVLRIHFAPQGETRFVVKPHENEKWAVIAWHPDFLRGKSNTFELTAGQTTDIQVRLREKTVVPTPTPTPTPDPMLEKRIKELEQRANQLESQVGFLDRIVKSIVDFFARLNITFSSAPQCKGDMNRDGTTNFADIEGFARLMQSPTADASLFWYADINNDGVLNQSDTDGFIRILAGMEKPVCR